MSGDSLFNICFILGSSLMRVLLDLRDIDVERLCKGTNLQM